MSSNNCDEHAIRVFHLGCAGELAIWLASQAAMLPDRSGRVKRAALRAFKDVETTLLQIDPAAGRRMACVLDELTPLFQRFDTEQGSDAGASELERCGCLPQPGEAYYEEFHLFSLEAEVFEICRSVTGSERPELLQLGRLIRQITAPPAALKDLVVRIGPPMSLVGCSLRSVRHRPFSDWRLRSWCQGCYPASVSLPDRLQELWFDLQLGEFPPFVRFGSPALRLAACRELLECVRSRLVSGRRDPSDHWETFGAWSFSSTEARCLDLVIDFEKPQRPLKLLRTVVKLGSTADWSSVSHLMGTEDAVGLRQIKKRLCKRLGRVSELDAFKPFLDDNYRLRPELLDPDPLKMSSLSPDQRSV